MNICRELASKQPRTQHQVSSKQQSVKYFTGLGTTPNIKPYLRFNGNIRNRNMTKVELLTIIREVWAKKQERVGFSFPFFFFFVVAKSSSA